jgi:hypothetical protein
MLVLATRRKKSLKAAIMLTAASLLFSRTKPVMELSVLKMKCGSIWRCKAFNWA